MSEAATSSSVDTCRERLMAARKLLGDFYGRPGSPGRLRKRADAAIEAFDRAEMKEVSAEAKASIEFLRETVLATMKQAHDAGAPLLREEGDAAKEAKKLLDDLGVWQAEAEKDIADLKDVRGDIARTIEKAEEAYAAGKAADAAIGDVVAELKKASDALRAQHDKLSPLHDQALAVAKSRDANALNKAKGSFQQAWDALERIWREGERVHREFAAQHLAKGAALTAGKRRAIQEQLDAALKVWQPNEVLRDGAGRWAKEVKELGVQAVDGKKAAAVLGFDAKEASAGADAMQGDETTVRKKLEALAKRLKHNASGKELLEKLRRAKMA